MADDIIYNLELSDVKMCGVDAKTKDDISSILPDSLKKYRPSGSSKQTKTTTSVSNVYQYKFQSARTDKRVSLNCAPLQKNTNTTDYIQRLRYVLGEGQYKLNTGQTIYGFLHSTLSQSCGLIFPYTPQVSFQHNVNYESIEITHSNLGYNFYKNTPPPTITIDATFTADTRENALHMLSALWFLRAVTKCDFGERAYVDKNKNCVPGMPPPILYLNGYNQIMDNIPVVITSFSYNLPKDKHYVALGVNLDSNVQAFNDRNLYSDVSSGEFFDNFDGNASGAYGMKYLNGIANSIKSLQESATIMESNRYNNFYFNNWLPTELSFNIQLKIQPNFLKHKKKFNLNWYKMGLFNLDDYKGGSTAYITNNGDVSDISASDLDCLTYNEVKTLNNGYKWLNYRFATLESAIHFREEHYKEELQKLKEGFDLNTSESVDIFNDAKNTLGFDKIVGQEKKKIIGQVTVSGKEIKDELQKNMTKKSYTFDRSGWTW